MVIQSVNTHASYNEQANNSCQSVLSIFMKYYNYTLWVSLRQWNLLTLTSNNMEHFDLIVCLLVVHVTVYNTLQVLIHRRPTGLMYIHEIQTSAETQCNTRLRPILTWHQIQTCITQDQDPSLCSEHHNQNITWGLLVFMIYNYTTIISWNINLP